MNTPESEFDLIPCDKLFSRIEENLSSFAANGLLDTEQFYPEVKWMISQLGLGVYEQDSSVVILSDYKVELPCDFYLLDSAWLCSKSKSADIDEVTQSYWQGKSVFFTVRDEKTILQGTTCPPPNQTGWCVNACESGNSIIDQVTLTEYVTGASQSVINWNSPVLLKLNNKKSIGKTCVSDCKNLFYSSPNEISINKKGGSYYLTSNLKDPVIYLKYWRFPMDRETKLPLIPNDAIIERALEDHLTHWLLVKLWTNGEVTEIENKIKYWEQKKINSVDAAKSYAKMPTFLGMANLARKTRRRWASYEQINSRHI